MRLASLVACVLCAVHGAAAADPHDLPALAVPGGLAAAMRVTGDARETAHAAFVYDIVRRFYNQPADANRTQDPTLRRLLTHIEEQRAESRSSFVDAVPSPLTPVQWRDMLGLPVDGTTDPDIGHVLASHDAALLYAALLRMPAATRAWLAPQTNLLQTLLPHAATLVIVAPVLERDADGWRLPGGDDARPMWARLTGRALDDSRLLDALLTRDGGWLAVTAEILGGLSPAQQRAALGLTPAPADPTAPDRLLRALRAAAAEWSPRQRPFWRPTLDPALLLLQLPATSDGLTLPGTTAQWSAILEGRRLPGPAPAASRTSASASRPQRPTPAWIVEHVFTGSMARRRTGYDQILFAQRLAGPAPRELDTTAASVVQALATHSQLVLTLERLGVEGPDLYARAVTLVRRLEGDTRDRARRGGARAPADRVEPQLVQLQAGLMLLVSASANGAISVATARVHVDGLLQAIDTDVATARFVDWLQSVVAAPREASGQMPRGLDEALLCLAAGPARAGVVHWEGTSYRIDPGAAAVARVGRLRGVVAGRLIDSAAGLVAHVRNAGADRTRLRAWLDEHRSLVDISMAGSGAGSGIWADLIGAWRQAAAVPTPPALLTVASQLATMGLVEMVYALAMGSGDELPLQPVEAARRHVFADAPAGMAGPWSAPAVVVDEGTRWHVRGSLLGVDVALAPLALRRATTRLPPRRPTFNTADRRALIESVPLVRRGALPATLAVDVHVAANAGRTRLAAAGNDTAACRDLVATLARGHLQAALLQWQCGRHPSDVAGMLSMRDVLALGGFTDPDRASARPAGIGRALGAVAQPITGAWALWTPPPVDAERYGGRWGTGIAASAFPHLHLRALDLLGELGLPAVLLPEVLSSLTWEFVTRVPAAYPDDWFALNEMVWRIDAEAAERALALHTGDGVLRVVP